MRRVKLNICALLLCLLFFIAQRGWALPFAVNDYAVADASQFALVQTTKGFFEMRFLINKAPVHVLNFQYLARNGFYNGLTFFRYFQGYILQSGDPNNDGSGGTGYTLPPEFSDVKHRRGTIAMSRIRGDKNPERESNGSQFYISLGESPQLDGLYSVFAEVVNGMDVVEKLRVGDKILSIRLSR